MKITLKELKVEDDGSELFYAKELGLIIKSETFSGKNKCCQGKNQGKETKATNEKTDIDLSALAPMIAHIIAQVSQKESRVSDDEGQDPNSPPAEPLTPEADAERPPVDYNLEDIVALGESAWKEFTNTGRVDKIAAMSNALKKQNERLEKQLADEKKRSMEREIES